MNEEPTPWLTLISETVGVLVLWAAFIGLLLAILWICD